mmetsp:Transcript_41257/g.78842  ORF Transcript_41257/g.78842 Transcript_41257/m.78842 type:complete len:294 (-) Transcript_41257:305-1186(-)
MCALDSDTDCAEVTSLPSQVNEASLKLSAEQDADAPDTATIPAAKPERLDSTQLQEDMQRMGNPRVGVKKPSRIAWGVLLPVVVPMVYSAGMKLYDRIHTHLEQAAKDRKRVCAQARKIKKLQSELEALKAETQDGDSVARWRAEAEAAAAWAQLTEDKARREMVEQEAEKAELEESVKAAVARMVEANNELEQVSARAALDIEALRAKVKLLEISAGAASAAAPLDASSTDLPSQSDDADAQAVILPAPGQSTDSQPQNPTFIDELSNARKLFTDYFGGGGTQKDLYSEGDK